MEKIKRRDANDAFQRIQLARRRAVHRGAARLGIKPFNPDGTWRWLTPSEAIKLDQHVTAVQLAMTLLMGHRPNPKSTAAVQLNT